VEQHTDQVRVARDKLVIKTGSVGEGKFRADATYALIDVHNDHARDLLVTLRGKLVDRAGKAVGTLREQMLRIPAHGMRMYSLVDVDSGARPAAVGADIELVEAVVPDYPPSVEITDGHVFIDNDRAVVQGNVVNTADREVAVVVMWGYYDADGKPMHQTSTKLKIDGKQQRGASWPGPPGSRRGIMFVGEYVH
jgi:hypothetical protein